MARKRLGRWIAAYLIIVALAVQGAMAREMPERFFPNESAVEAARTEKKRREDRHFSYSLLEDGSGIRIDRYYAGLAAEVTVPETLDGYPVREIGAGAFQECDLLVSIALPEGIDAIGEGAFRQCAALETVDLPDGLTEIAPFTFWGCKKLENISLPDGLVSIGEEAFAYCASLSAVSLPEGLARIGDFAFSGCNSLKAISLPAGLRHVGINPFFACAALETFSVPPEHPCFFADGGVLYEKAARTLVAYPASRAGRAFAVPEGVAAIGSGAFAGCATLASVSLPEGLASIGNLAFF